jgi:hypothetical protein
MPSSRRWRKKVAVAVQREVASRGVRTHEANVSLIEEGIKRWRLQYDPADDCGPTMSEYLVDLLEQEGRLR